MSDKDRLVEHEYDGIQEYDNPMPRWWVTIFWATIVFSVIYAINVGGIGSGEGRIAQYEADMAAWREAHPQGGGPADAASLLALADDAEAKAEGGATYQRYCAACHVADGGGLIGPNLTDDYWLHGGTIDSIHTVIVDGVLAKGMPPWGKTLTPAQVNQVTAYVWSLHGTTPKQPKAPQGERVAPVTTAPAPAGRVLPTLNVDGTRNWLRPKPSPGPWWRRRRVVAYVLLVAFIAIPHLRINGKPAILLDAPRREFTLFGTTFLPTDTLLLMLLLASLVIAVFLFSALFGRVWCGWACPQTVYLEFLFRPIERLIEGGRSGSLRLDRANAHFHPRRILKYAIYLALSLLLAHTFLAYFVGVDALAEWVRLSPREHPVPFLVMATTTALVFTDFTWFREQTCLIACPYGRWQSALLDRQSLVVAYDYNRGEPRARGKVRAEGAGDCIDCAACVTTCPTGIDIRNGLQMECVHCTQCMDACDHIMAQVGKPPGLIRYATQDALAGKAKKVLRPRVVLYPLALVLFVGAFVAALGTRATADITLLRSPGEPFQVEADGRVANQVRIRIANRTHDDQTYTITIEGAEPGQVIAPESPLAVEAGKLRTTSVFVLLPRDALPNGRRDITVRVSDGHGFDERLPFNLLGPTDTLGGLHP